MSRGREPRPENPKLEALKDEQVHIRIQISLTDERKDPAHAKMLRDQLAEIEQQIRACK